MESIWSASNHLPNFPILKGDIKTDVLVIGGGITGILCTYQLQQAGVNCILVEANKLCSGITKNTTAKITSQHGLLYHKLLHRFGKEKTTLYLNANELAIIQYAELCKNIPCDFEWSDAFVYTKNHPNSIEQELDALAEIGYWAEYVNELPLPFCTAGAIKFKKQAQFHPLKFLSTIAKNLTVFEKTNVLHIKDNTAITPFGKITAKHMIIATHFPFINRYGYYFLKMYQHRSYVLALKNAQNVNGMYVDEAQTGLSFRNYHDFLLLGGGSHRTGKQGGNWKELEYFCRKYYPNAKEVYRFATQDCMTLDEIPYIGLYSKSTPNLYVATGFHKWGMSSAMVASTILRDQILGKENPYASVFSPSRSILRPQLFINIWESGVNLLSFSTKRCPHLGCALKWNPAEHSWDCPCHGSRFTENGTLIDNPAKEDLTKSNKSTTDGA